MLTTLDNAKTWLESTTIDDDVLLLRLINQISSATLNYIQRPNIYRTSFTEVRNGVGNQRLTLRNWPVISVASVTVDASSIPAQPSLGQSGYQIIPWDGTPAGNPQELVLNGYCYSRGLGNVQIVYDAGYAILNEAHTVPSSLYKVTVLAPYGTWMQDDGVTYADGTALTKVASAPSTGQYSLDPASGVYQFSSGDASTPVLISYSYVPFALEEGVIEWVGERYRYKDRIGESSKTLGGQETVAYIVKKIPDHIAGIFEPFRKSFPL